MANINIVALDGTICNEPELRYTPGKDGLPPVPSLHFQIACNRPVSKFSTKQKTDYIHIVQWGQKAEATSKGIRKGAQVAITGFLQSRNFDRKEEVKEEAYMRLLDVLQENGISTIMNVEDLAAGILGALGLDGSLTTLHTAYEVCAQNIEFREGCGAQQDDSAPKGEAA